MDERISVPFLGSVSMGVRTGSNQCVSDFQRERQEYKVKAYVQTPTGKAETKSKHNEQNKSQLGSGTNSTWCCLLTYKTFSLKGLN